MPLIDMPYNSEVKNCGAPDCAKNGVYWMPPPPPPEVDCPCPPPPLPPPYYPYPPRPYPPFPPFPPHPVPPPEPEPEPSKTSIEGQICKLSKKAAVITKMIDALENKKKDVIMKTADMSYNFGNIDLEVDGWDDGSYAATALKVLKYELGLIKAKIAELSAEIGEEADNLIGTETTVAGDG